jgi:hypothetical protein
MLNGQPWVGRGVNLPDVYGCGQCSDTAASVAALKGRIDYLAKWGMTMIRVVMNATASDLSSTSTQYMKDLVDVVKYASKYPTCT